MFIKKQGDNMINIKKKRRNTDEGIAGSNGIMIDGDITAAYNKELTKDRFKIIQFLIAFFTAVFTVTMTISYIDIDVMLKPIIFFIFMLTLAFTAVSCKNKLMKLVGAAYILFHTIVLISLSSNIFDGFFVTVDQYLTEAKQINSLFGAYLQNISVYNYDYYATHFFIFLSSIIVCVLAIACIFRTDFPLMFIITFPFFEFGMYWELKPSTASVIGLVICWVTVLSIQIINHSTNKAGKNNTFAVHKKKKAFYFTSEVSKHKFFTVYALEIALLCFVVFLIPVIFANITDFYRTNAMDEARVKISKAVDEFSFNQVKNMFDDYDGGLNLFSVKTVGGTNGGILGQNDGISFNGSTALKVQTGKPDYPLYLRGYVAGKYEDNRWKEINYDEGDSRLKAFDELNYYVQDYNYYANNYYTDLGEDKEISVSVVGASKKFVYAPYMTSYASDTNEGDDKMIPERESFVNLRKKKYSLLFMNMSKSGSNWNDIISKLLNSRSYITDELSSEYYDFVCDYYTDTVRSESIDKAYNEIIDEYMYGDPYLPDGEDITYYIESISEYFDENYKYTLTPGATPEGEDFIDYFLTEQKEGYCSYFASAGVMLMRKFGVPARYVEGYVVLPTQFDGDSNSANATVTDKSAHAWCEIFIQDIGWVPCEFTPGYRNDNPNLTDKEKDPSRYEKTKTSTTTTTGVTTTTSRSTNQTTSAASTTAKATTTKKSTTNNDNPGINGSGSGSNSTDGTNSGNTGLVKLTAAYLLGLLAVIAAIILRRKYNLSEMHKKLNKSDNTKAIQSAYRFYLKYLSLASVGTNKNITDMQAVEELLRQCSDRGINGIEKSFIRLAELAVESFMSENKMTDDEADFARNALKELSDEIIYPKLSTFGRFTAKWLYNLY